MQYNRSRLSWKMRSPGFLPPGDDGKSNFAGVIFGMMPLAYN